MLLFKVFLNSPIVCFSFEGFSVVLAPGKFHSFFLGNSSLLPNPKKGFDPPFFPRKWSFFEESPQGSPKNNQIGPQVGTWDFREGLEFCCTLRASKRATWKKIA